MYNYSVNLGCFLLLTELLWSTTEEQKTMVNADRLGALFSLED